MRKKIERPFLQPVIYPVVKFFTFLIFLLGWRLKVQGKENIPKIGGVIFAANHRSLADPPLVGSSMSRQVHFLAKEELFSFKPFGWILRNLNAHPLNRNGGDIATLRMAKRFLESGKPIVMFPEGKRGKTDVLQPAKSGVGLLARMARVPIVPVYVHNSAFIWSFPQLLVSFGIPIQPEGYSSDQAIADEVMHRIHEMKKSVG